MSRPAMRRIAALLAVLFGCLLLAGCSAVRSTVDTVRALDDAGYRGLSVNIRTPNGDIDLVVRATAGPPPDPVEEAARIVWGTFKVKFDQADIKVGEQRHVYTYEEMRQLFGPRPPGSEKSFTRDVLTGVLIVGAIGVVVLAIVLVVVLIIVRSVRKKRRPPPGPYGGYGYGPPPGYGYPPPGGYPQGGYPPPQYPPQQYPPQQYPPPQWPPPQEPPS